MTKDDQINLDEIGAHFAFGAHNNRHEWLHDLSQVRWEVLIQTSHGDAKKTELEKLEDVVVGTHVCNSKDWKKFYEPHHTDKKYLEHQKARGYF